MDEKMLERAKQLKLLFGVAPGVLMVSLNDGTTYRILGSGEEPIRVDARVMQDLAAWPVQTGMNSLIPVLTDPVTAAFYRAMEVRGGAW